MKYITILLFLISIASCNVKVHTTQDHSADFSQYKTFCWLEGCEFTYSGPSYLDDSLWRETIKDAIIVELAERGIVQDENNPDLLIDFHISVENESSVIYHHIDNQYDFQPISESEEENIHYLKGTMIIHVVDKAQDKMVWSSESIGYMSINPKLTERNFRKGIALTLKKFPSKD